MKRLLIVSMVIVLAMGGLSIMSVAASEIAPDRNTRLQDDGRAWLGVGIVDGPNGVIITAVEPASPADDARLFIRDVITAIDGMPVDTAQDVIDAIAARAPGDVVTLTIARRGTERDIDVMLGTWPEEDIAVPAPSERPRLFQGRMDFLGLQASVTDEGLQIDSLDSDSPLAETDLQIGDVITAINGQSVLEQMRLGLLLNLLTDEPLVFTVLRDGEELEIAVEANLLDELPEMMPDLDMLPYMEDMPGMGAMMGMGEELLSLLGLDASLTDEGLSIEAVEAGSPAADAGLQAGDLITAINGVTLAGLEPRDMMQALWEGEGELVLTVLRDGESIEITAEANLLEDLLEMMPGLDMLPMDLMPMMGRPTQLGVSFLTLDAELAAERDLTVEDGALIEEVYPDTPAETAGLQVGDIVTAVDGDPVDAQRTLSERLYAYQEGDQVTLTVIRNGEELSLDVTLGPRGYGFGFHGSMLDMPDMRFHRGQGMHRFDFEDFFHSMPFDGGPFEHHWRDVMPDAEMMPDGPSA